MSVSAASQIDSHQAHALLKALADPPRLQVIESLAAGERCVCDLAGELDLGQTKLSFHLKVLKQAGLLTDRQDGRWIYYRLQGEALEALALWLGELSASCRKPAALCL
ncbi:MAG: metalloregulator ArsR/SmtB family transcription factor [Cyanobacteria bacterium]|nr:metalloregulator ArsR/SmtB family transcription factor [Cyanobacteriota bacterium]